MNPWAKAAVRSSMAGAVLVVAVWITEHFAGLREWERVQARIAAEGESLEVRRNEAALSQEEDFLAAEGVLAVMGQHPDSLKRRPGDYAAALKVLAAAAQTRRRTSYHPRIWVWSRALNEEAVAAAGRGEGPLSLEILRVCRCLERSGYWELRRDVGEPMRVGAAAHIWDEAALAEWQTTAASVDLAAELLVGKREDAAMLNALYEEAIKRRSSGGMGSWHGLSDAWNDAMWKLAPEGALRRQQAVSVVAAFDAYVLPLRDGGLLGWYRRDRDVTREPRRWTETLRPDLAIKDLRSASESRKALGREVTNRQTVIACELERHFLRSGRYPVALSELGAEVSEKLPNDLNEQPMGYESSPDGARYRLWSVGPDFDLAPAGKVGAVWEWKVRW